METETLEGILAEHPFVRELKDEYVQLMVRCASNVRFDARSLERTRALGLDATCLRIKCEEDHDLGYELLKRFVLVVEQRLQATRFQLLNVYS
jgi:hypothetical protein